MKSVQSISSLPSPSGAFGSGSGSCSRRSSGFSSPSSFAWSSDSTMSSTSSSRGFWTISFFRICWSSSVGTCSNFRACCRRWVMISAGRWLRCSPCLISIKRSSNAFRKSQGEPFPEVELARLGVRGQELGAAFDQDPALVHDGGAIGDAQRLAHVVVRDQHPETARLESRDDVLDLGHGNRVDADERFVEQKETRLRHQ